MSLPPASTSQYSSRSATLWKSISSPAPPLCFQCRRPVDPYDAWLAARLATGRSRRQAYRRLRNDPSSLPYQWLQVTFHHIPRSLCRKKRGVLPFHPSCPAINTKNHGRQTVSAQSRSQCSTAMILSASHTFLVLPIVICSRTTTLSLDFVTTSKCHSCPCAISTGMAGQGFVMTAVGLRSSFHSSSQRRSQASIHIPICGLPSVQDFIGDLVSICIAKGKSCATLVMWFQDFNVFVARGRRVRYALAMVESGFRQKT